MPAFIGRIPVPEPVSSGQTFPLVSNYPFGFSQERPTVTHRFGELDGKAEQRFQVGLGPRRFQFRRENLNYHDRHALADFWEALQGPTSSFTYNVPNPDGSVSPTTVVFDAAPLSFQYLRNAVQVGLTFVEVISGGPTYAVNSTCLRFPSSAMQAALLSQVQQIIPLVHIRVREAAAPDIYLSDRRVTIGSQLYLPRLLGMGEQGSNVILSQDIKGTADDVRFTFGNADRVMTLLANDTDLKFAQIDLSLFHVNSGILLQLWSGFVINFAIDGSPQFSVQASDGLYQITQAYPPRAVSRSCWKTFNDGLGCPYATHGDGGDPAECDYYFDSANGCLAHGMTAYFGGQPAEPQGVIIKDNSTGVWGLGRNMVTATSIISDTIWGNTLQEIWCNSGGDPTKAFWTNCMIAAGRDEGDYYDALGIVGAGPVGAFTPMTVAQNADGYRFVVAPLLDGQTPQGFQVDGNLNIKKNQRGMGIRQVAGTDPQADSFSLGQGTPQVWGPQTAAGTSFVELRITKPSGISPTPADQHQMQVPIDQGLAGWVWDQNGTRVAKPGLTNPFWIAVNMLLRSLGLGGNILAPLATTTIEITLPPSSFFGFNGLTLGLFTVGLAFGSPIALVAGLIGLIGGAFTGNAFSVPMSNAANQAELILRQNGDNWQNLPTVYQTTANQSIFIANFNTIWNAYVAACNVIFQGDPNGSDAKKALNRSIGDRSRGGKFDWFAYYLDPIANSATPGDSVTTQDLSTEQLSKFVLSSLAVGDGTGAAEIADNAVAAILGTGTETQFQFQGSIAQQKPFRDWLTEVLSCALGYYTFEFGRLKLGCRINASATEAFTLGNILFQSLRLTPIEAAYEHLIIDFADQAYQYQANTAEYEDKSHAAYYGRAGSPLTSRMHSVGICSLSQASRIAAVRTREEIGGVNETEWRNARVASWKTTVLALNTEAGQVVSLTHPDVPGGYGDFRIQSWRLNKDWSIDISAKTVTPSMYDLTVGPKPIDVTPAPLPPIFYPIPFAPAWAPYQIQAPSWDALFPSEWTFDSNQQYTTLADGSVQVSLSITGKLPVNQFSPTRAGTPVVGTVTQSKAEGALPANSTVRVAVCAIDLNGFLSFPSNILVVGTSETGTDSLTLSNIRWPAVPGLSRCALFASTDDALICAQATGTLTAASDGTTYSPNAITFAGPLARSTWALPSPYVSRVRIKMKSYGHFGIMGVPVDGVTAPDQIICVQLIDTSSTPPNLVGRILSVIGRQGDSTPLLSVTITAYDPSTGTLTVSPHAVVAGDPEQSIQATDVVIVRMKADAPNTADPTQISDSGWLNSQNDHVGLTPDTEVGDILRVIHGTGRGQLRKLTGNTATGFSWDLPLALDETSIWIIEKPAWEYVGDSPSVGNADFQHQATLTIPAGNFANRPILIAGFTVDINGVESPDGEGPVREDWVYGQQGTPQPVPSRTVVTDTTVTPLDGKIWVDAAAAPVTVTMCPIAQLTNNLTIGKIDGTANPVYIVCVAGDAIQGQNTQILDLTRLLITISNS